MGCLIFCKKFQGYHKQVVRDFVLNFDRKKTKVGPLEMEVSLNSIATSTEIPKVGEQWFKVEKLQMADCNDLLEE